jgi:hypothetical protein
MKCDSDLVQRCFKSEEEQNIQRSKHEKKGDKSSTLNKRNSHSNQETGLVDKDYPHSVTGGLGHNNNNIDLLCEISKKNNKKCESNSKFLIQKLILLVKYTMKRMKNGSSADQHYQDIRSIVSTYGIGNNNIKEIEEEEEEQTEIETKSGYRIIVSRNLSPGFDRLVIMNDRTISKTCYNNPEQKTNSIRIDLSQNSVLLSTEASLKIQASNINIEASESMNLKSGSIMTINGSLVRIN